MKLFISIFMLGDMYMVYNSCLNCEKRKIGCHQNCESYEKYKAKIKVINANRKEAEICYIKQRRDFYERRYK